MICFVCEWVAFGNKKRSLHIHCMLKLLEFHCDRCVDCGRCLFAYLSFANRRKRTATNQFYWLQAVHNCVSVFSCWFIDRWVFTVCTSHRVHPSSNKTYTHIHAQRAEAKQIWHQTFISQTRLCGIWLLETHLFHTLENFYRSISFIMHDKW